MAKLTRLKRSSPKQVKLGVLTQKSLLQWVVDFDAAGCIALKHGVCLALKLDPLAFSGPNGLALPEAMERTYRTALFRFADDKSPGRISSTAPSAVIEGDILVKPDILFSWLKAYLLELPRVIEQWLEAPEEAVRDCRITLDPETDDDGMPFVLDKIPEKEDRQKQRTRKGHLQNHELTAREILAVMMLSKFGDRLRGNRPDWSFIPEGTTMKEIPIGPGAKPPTVGIMRAHIARSVVDLLTSEQAARDYPGLLRLAESSKKGVQ